MQGNAVRLNTNAGISGNQNKFRMTQNQTRRFNNKCHDNHKNIVRNERTNYASESETAGKTFELINLGDFPELRTTTISHNVPHLLNTNNRKAHSNKSWLSVVSEKSTNNFKDAFPKLPENNKSNGCELISKNDDRKSQPFMVNDSVVAENLVAIEKEKAQNLMNPKESKPKSSKKAIFQPPRNPYKKKRSDPLFINPQDILLVNKPQKRVKKNAAVKNRHQLHRNKEVLSGNYLDSSNPVRNRGKHREVKKRKPTKLKLAIIKERIIKQKMKENAATSYITGSECFHLIENMDFKVEIKKYLDELRKKKSEKTLTIHKPLNKSLKPEKYEESAKEITNVNAIKEINKEANSENTGSDFKVKKIPDISVDGEIKFSSKFREYCDNIITPALNTAVSDLIRDLVKLQDRQYARDPIKAKTKKRLVSGLREVKKYLILKKVKLIIIAPNLEKLQMEGSVYDSINELKSMANDQNVPYGFALDRFALGKCTKKNVPISAFAVMYYEGIEMLFQNALHHLNAAKESFMELSKLNKVEEDVKEDVNAPVLSSLIAAFRQGLLMSKESSEFELE